MTPVVQEPLAAGTAVPRLPPMTAEVPIPRQIAAHPLLLTENRDKYVTNAPTGGSGLWPSKPKFESSSLSRGSKLKI